MLRSHGDVIRSYCYWVTVNKMAKSASVHQAAYRERRATPGDNGEHRINTWVSAGASLALARLAARYCVTHCSRPDPLLRSV